MFKILTEITDPKKLYRIPQLADWSSTMPVGLPVPAYIHARARVSIPLKSFQEDPTHSDVKDESEVHPITGHEGPEEE